MAENSIIHAAVADVSCKRDKHEGHRGLSMQYLPPTESVSEPEVTFGYERQSLLGNSGYPEDGSWPDKLLKHLVDFTKYQPEDSKDLPVDFQVTVLLLRYMGEHGTALRDIHGSIEQLQDDLARKVDELREDFEVFQTSGHFQKPHAEVDSFSPTKTSRQVSGASELTTHARQVSGASELPSQRYMTYTSQETSASEIASHLRFVPSEDAAFLHQQNSLLSTSEHTLLEHGKPNVHLGSPGKSTTISDEEDEQSAPFRRSSSSQSLSSAASCSEKGASSKKTKGLAAHSVLGEMLQEEHLARKMFENPTVEWICSCVIIANAITIGLSAQLEIDWRLSSKGGENMPNNAVLSIVDNCYILFYVIELICRLYVYRGNFFTCQGWKWNVFDLILVVAGVYDFIQAIAPVSFGGGGLGVTWLRLLRLLKMTKMMRIVRVMRFFRVLRMMVMSIMGSMSTLFWSILMMIIMLYMFALCFLQAVSGYLKDNHGNVPEEIHEGITTYYPDVATAGITLYMAVTGGADWEPLAAPVRESGTIFYALFLFYIAFASFAVLNVLTGMFVDTAMKVSEQDDEMVQEEMADRPEVESFRAFWLEQHDADNAKNSEASPRSPSQRSAGDDIPEVMISGLALFRYIRSKDPTVLSFFKALQMSPEEAIHLYETLVHDDDGVPAEEFIERCLQAKNSYNQYHLAAIHVETKKLVKEFKTAMLYMEDRFNETFKALAKKKSKVDKLQERWARVVFRPQLHHQQMLMHDGGRVSRFASLPHF